MRDDEQAEQGHSLDPSLFIRAYEADIIRGHGASQAAASLEVFDYGTLADMTVPVRKIGDALIQWGGDDKLGKPPAFPGDEDDLIGSSKQTTTKTKPQIDEKGAVWVDRYVVPQS
jgi:hypothetical protein